MYNLNENLAKKLFVFRYLTNIFRFYKLKFHLSVNLTVIQLIFR